MTTEMRLMALTLDMTYTAMLSGPMGLGEASTDDICDCNDCKRSDEPCHCDCNEGDECTGCYESRMDIEDARFEGMCAQGRY